MRKPVLFDETGEERVLPYKWEICPGCEGEGKSSAYLGAFTGAQMREDQDFAEEYMRGEYDRTCEECGGRGTVKVADFDRMTEADRKEYLKQQADIAEIDLIQRQERLMEGGWREEGWYE